jgi:cytochrome c biogenesis protein CcmG/thiol:disulfide interchange protein DsbE
VVDLERAAAAPPGMAVPTEAVGGTPPRRARTALWTAVGVGVLLAALVGVLATREPAVNKLTDSPLLGRPAPAIEGVPLLNGDFDVAGARGKWVLVHFFATYCVPCIEEHDDLVSFSRRHRASGDAEVVSVVFSDQASDVERFFRRRGGEWPVFDDPEGRVALEYGAAGVPESYLIDPDGFVVAKIIGGVRADRLDELMADITARAAAGR